MYNLKRLELISLANAKAQKDFLKEQKEFVQEQKEFVQEQKEFLKRQDERDSKYKQEQDKRDAKYEAERKQRQIEQKEADAKDKQKREEERKYWDAKNHEVNKRIAEVTGTIGDVAEFEFYQAIVNNNRVCCGIAFDEVHANVTTSREYDIVLVNGSYIGLVEVKWSPKISDVNKLMNEQIPYFKKDVKACQNKKIVGFLGMYVYDKKVAEHAIKNGIGVLYENGQALGEEYPELTIF